MTLGLVLVLLFDIACIYYVYTDYRNKRAPNWLTLPTLSALFVIGAIAITYTYG